MRNYDFRFLCGDDHNSNPYAFLGLKNGERNTTLIKKKGRELKAVLHPDKNPNNEYAQRSFIIATHALDLLSDPKLKAGCDMKLGDRYGWYDSPWGHDAALLNNFYNRKTLIDQMKSRAEFKAFLKAKWLDMRKLPRVFVKEIDRWARVRSGRVQKWYRDLIYGRTDRSSSRGKKSSGKLRSLRTSTISSHPTRTIGIDSPTAGERPVNSRPSFPISGAAPTKIITITETETVTKTETETQTITDTGTIFGYNVGEHCHDFAHYARQLKEDQPWILWAAGSVVLTICAAGCWMRLRKRRAKVQGVAGGTFFEQLNQNIPNVERVEEDISEIQPEPQHEEIDIDGNSLEDEDPERRRGDNGVEDISEHVNLGPVGLDHGVIGDTEKKAIQDDNHQAETNEEVSEASEYVDKDVVDEDINTHIPTSLFVPSDVAPASPIPTSGVPKNLATAEDAADDLATTPQLKNLDAEGPEEPAPRSPRKKRAKTPVEPTTRKTRSMNPKLE